MAEFVVKLAGIPFLVNTVYEDTREYCMDYVCDEKPLLCVTVDENDIAYEQKVNEKNSNIRIYDGSIEPLALLRKLSETLLDHDVLLFHGSAVAVNGKAYIFTASSGTGKSTHTNLWLKNFQDCEIINGDKPFIAWKDGKAFVCGSPWCGKERYGTNKTVPLDGICILERDVCNHIRQIPFAEGFSTLLKQCYKPQNKARTEKLFRLVSMLGKTKLYRLGCNMEDEAALVSYRGMVRE